MVRRVFSLLRLCLLLSATGFSGLAQDVRVTAFVDSTNYRIGDWITVRLKAEGSSSLESLQPILGDSLGRFEVLNVEQVGPRSWNARLTTFDTGRVVLPPIEFSYRLSNDTLRRSASSNPAILTVTAPTVDLQADIRDIRPPLDAPWLFEDFLPYLIVLVLAGFAILLNYYYRKRKRAIEPRLISSPAIAPHTLALMRLRDLEDKRLWQQGKVKEFYSEATEIIRRFFEGRYGIPALEITSDEVLHHLKAVTEAKRLSNQLQFFFTTADLVKFAKYEPTPAEHENELNMAYEIVRSMIPHEPVPSESAEETADVR